MVPVIIGPPWYVIGTAALALSIVELPPWRMPVTPFLPWIPDWEEWAEGAARAAVVKHRAAKAEAVLKSMLQKLGYLDIGCKARFDMRLIYTLRNCGIMVTLRRSRSFSVSPTWIQIEICIHFGSLYSLELYGKIGYVKTCIALTCYD